MCIRDSCLSKFWLSLTETSSLNQSLVCQAKCVCDSQIGFLGATKRNSWCRRQGRCLLVWKASSGLFRHRVFFRHHKSSSGIGKTKQLLVGHRKKSLLMSEKVDRATAKKMTSRKSWGRGKFERYVQGELCKVLGRGKKRSKKAIHQTATSEAVSYTHLTLPTKLEV